MEHLLEQRDIKVEVDSEEYYSDGPSPVQIDKARKQLLELEKLRLELAMASSVKESRASSSSGGASSNSNANSSIYLGQVFQSFAKVSEAVRNYELENNVNLSAKYFRRIAANPKPSNKEDYALTVEERKRFVYRWVDFCCTYFDGRTGSLALM